METKHIHCVTTVNATAKKAFQQIANVAGWWATNVQGKAEKVGDEFIVRFGKTFSIIRVEEVVPYKRITWLVTDCYLPLFKDEKEWAGTQMIWEISPAGQATEIAFTHKGIVPGKWCYEDCTKGWNFYVTVSLHNLLLQGRGLPGTGIFTYLFTSKARYEGLLFFKNDPLPVYSEEYLYVDVKETRGEEVLSGYNAGTYNQQTFQPQHLQGEYFMLIENKAVTGDIRVLDDLIAWSSRQDY